MRRTVFALLIVVALAFVPAGADEQPCTEGPFACTADAAVWSVTHPMQAINPANWHKECLPIAGCVIVPDPIPGPNPGSPDGFREVTR